MLSGIKNFLKEQKINFFLLPNSDEFFSEYLPESEKRIEYLTGFNGSNATVIFGQDKSYFFTDGRYTLQAKNQLDLQEFEIFNMAEKSVLAWISENCSGEINLAIDAKLVSVNFVKACEKMGANLVLLDSNPVDQIWQNRPKSPKSTIFSLSSQAVGVDSQAKRATILQSLQADAQIITKPENLCWLTNLRAADIEFTPLLLAYAILYKNGKVEIFAESNRLNIAATDQLKDVEFVVPQNFTARLQNLGKVQIDLSTTNHWLYSFLQKNGSEIINKTDPIELAKSRKNSAEILGAIKAHEIDGLAVTRFLCWLKNCDEVDEISAAEKLLQLRQENPAFLYESFAAISGFGSNGAIIHYRANEHTNKKISGDSLYLIDSGGQYLAQDFCATTDITRTLAIGKASEEMIENFTRVLKGHIALARAKFPRGTTGAQLDVLARQHLWQAGLDYDHGTGHGVGSFLSVHEGPCGVSKRYYQELLPGMIISNEPGFYKNGEYGIRIENLLLVEEFDVKFLHFKTLTLAPIDAALIDFKMLTYPEKKWLRNYHQEIWQKFSEILSGQERQFLQEICIKFGCFA